MDQLTGTTQQAVVKAFDIGSNSIKTTLVNAAVDITVSALNDSIAIADASGNKATTSVVGAKRGLDVNVIDITLDAANDSVAIKNGANTLAVNADGSTNAVTVSAGFTNIVQTGIVAVGLASTQLFTSNINRKYAHLMNNSTTAVYLQYGSAAIVGRGIKLGPGAMLIMSGYELYYGQVNAISTVAVNIDTLEGT